MHFWNMRNTKKLWENTILENTLSKNRFFYKYAFRNYSNFQKILKNGEKLLVDKIGHVDIGNPGGQPVYIAKIDFWSTSWSEE